MEGGQIRCVKNPASLRGGGRGHSSINCHTADEAVRQEPTMAIEQFVTKVLWCSIASLGTDSL